MKSFGRNIVGHCEERLEISQTAYEEIRQALERSGGRRRILDAENDGMATLDMCGIELLCAKPRLSPSPSPLGFK